MSATAWLLAGTALGAGLALAYVVRRVRKIPKVPLGQSIQLVADQPSDLTSALFRAALARTPVVVLPVAADAPAGDDVQVETHTGPGGEMLLLTYCDPAAAKAVDPEAKLVAVTIHDALVMVGKGGLGGLAVKNAEGACGCVLAPEIPTLLQRVPQVGVVS